MVSRVLGFVRDLAISYTMGASATVAADAYNTALAFPNLFRRIFAEGAFAAAFVPAYARKLQAEGEESADLLAADAMATLAAATILLTMIIQLAMPWLMHLIAPGFAQDPVKFKLAVILTQITMPYLPCMAIYAHLAGVLQTRGRFVVSALAPTLLNIGMLIAVLPQRDPISAAYAASWAVLASGVAQAGLLWWGVRKSGARVDIRLPRLTPEIKALIGLAIPGAIAASATQINIFISGVLASQVNGARSWLAVADRLYQLPLSLVGVAIGVALLPRLSSALQTDDRREAQSATDEAITLALAFSLPAAAALTAMPYFLIDALFTRGQFTPADADQTARALFHYGWGTPAFVMARVLAPAFFARRDTKSPMRFALVSVAVNIGLGVTLFQIVGFEGIAAATAAAAWLNVTLMWVTLGRRKIYRPSPRAISQLGKVLLASVALGAMLAAASALRPLYEPYLLRKEIAVVVVVALGGVAYAALLFAVKAVRPADLRRALKRRPRAAATEPTDNLGDLP
jgi:putative peptidoglycan lipid II flippase